MQNQRSLNFEGGSYKGLKKVLDELTKSMIFPVATLHNNSIVAN